MRRILTLFGAALLMAGCSVYRPYVRPAVQADGLYGTGVAQGDTASIATLHWSELFTDPDLQALIRIGLENNTDLAVARLRVEQAEATLMASRLAYLPSATLSPQGQLSSFDGSKPAKTYNIGASAEWELDIFGRLTNSKRRAKAALLQSDAYRQAVQTQVVSAIANAYYNLLLMDTQLDINRRTAAVWEENLRTYEARMRVGEANGAAVAQARASKLAVDAAILTLRKQVRAQENALSTLIGQMPQAIRRGTLADQHFPDSLSVGVPLQLLARRPDIRQAEMALAQAHYATGEARSAFYPRITLSGRAGWTNTDGSAIINPGNWLLSALAGLTQPLFNRGQNIANLRIAKSQRQEALLQFRQSLLKAGAEVNDALSQWQTARARIGVTGEQIASLEEAVKSTTSLMESSTGASYIEVLTARRDLLAAELAQVQDRFDEIQGVISLYHALGGGGE